MRTPWLIFFVQLVPFSVQTPFSVHQIGDILCVVYTYDLYIDVNTVFDRLISFILGVELETLCPDNSNNSV